ncbi:tol-pal system protein YbgF [Idiomarina sp.]|uniref:tol-pal system protein YbgF n=1 Tax=Idiomarina sp. TaxID=1874361 RepID=UPI0025BBA771|nr:tol-pal system protein YbgF [Idiomarina sp.]NQZ04686.1 tol-pal system protein YbgF [Idiomarina sp.]
MKKSLLAICLLMPAAAMAQAPVSSLNQSASSLEQRLATIERMLDARQGAQLEMLNTLSSLQQDVAELRGITEEHEYRLEQLLERQREIYQEIDRRFSQLKQQGGGSSYSMDDMQTVPTSSNSGNSTASNSSNSGYSANMSENDAYDKAIALVLEDKRYDAAIPAFESFLQNFPNSTYVPNAHYWLGQLLYAQQEYQKAHDHFKQVVDNYPDSNKRADCLLKLGVIAAEQGKTADAKTFYQQVLTEYSDSTEANLAKQRLSNL